MIGTVSVVERRSEDTTNGEVSELFDGLERIVSAWERGAAAPGVEIPEQQNKTLKPRVRVRTPRVSVD